MTELSKLFLHPVDLRASGGGVYIVSSFSFLVSERRKLFIVGIPGGLLAFDSHSRVVVVRGWDLIPVPSVLVLSQLRAEGLCHRKIDDVVGDRAGI